MEMYKNAAESNILMSPQKLVSLGIDLWDLKDGFISSGVDPDVFDKDFNVRAKVAEKGDHLDLLVFDKHPEVRIKVAGWWYGLDRLAKDSDQHVVEFVERYINDRNSWI